MKRIFYTLCILLTIGAASCKKNNELSIKQYDDNQIQAYIQQNGLTGMKRDTSGGDTTGIYYQILSVGTGPVVDYPSQVSYVYSYQTFDNAYSATDTIANHTTTFLGHVTPNAVQLSLKNIAKRKGTKVRLLIPSRLAFGTNGYFAGSVQINGNECLDYTVNLIDEEYDTSVKPAVNHLNVYDDISIKKYMVANSLTGFTKTASGLYYKINTPGVAGGAPITVNSTVGVQYTGTLFNGTAFDTETNADPTVAALTVTTLYNYTSGFAEGLQLATSGANITLLIPSNLAYGPSANNTIPAFSCLRFDISVISVTN